MASAGWYPDPDGTPARQRWWDGGSWTPQTRPGPDPRKVQRARLAVIALLVIMLVLGGLLIARARGWLPGSGAASPTPSASFTPLPNRLPLGQCDFRPEAISHPSDPAGPLRGGRLATPRLDGWEQANYALLFGETGDFLHRQITAEWGALLSLGAVYPEQGYTDLTDGALLATACLVEDPQIYPDGGEPTVVTSEATTVDGYPAHFLRTRMLVPGYEHLGLSGDYVDVLLVDDDQGSFSIFVSLVAIEATDVLAQVEQAREALTVEP